LPDSETADPYSAGWRGTARAQAALVYRPAAYVAQNAVYSLLIVGGPASLGLLLRAYEQLADPLDELTARREREHELVAHTVLAQERTRIAREMHDVMSHRVSLIAVQVGPFA
jgi:signal transduction histidine kinase